MATQGVEERTKGTMPEVEGRKSPETKGKIPEDASKVSPEDNTPKFTQAEYDAGVHAAAKSEGGRAAKALEVREQAVKVAEAKEAERIAARDAEELAAAEGDKEQLTIVQQRQKNRADAIANKLAREQFEKEKAEHQADIDAANATKFEIAVFNIAAKYEVDADDIKNYSIEFGVTDLKQLEAVAKRTSTQKPSVPDSGRTIGGGEPVPASAKGKMLSGWEKRHPTK